MEVFPTFQNLKRLLMIVHKFYQYFPSILLLVMNQSEVKPGLVTYIYNERLRLRQEHNNFNVTLNYILKEKWGGCK